MKTESPNQDPLADAAQALEHAMADAQRAIAAARAAPAPVVFALAESQKKCAALKIKIVALEELGSRQRQELATAALNADRAAKEHDRYKAKMTREQLTERVAWSADRIGLVASRDALKMQVDALEADRERLRQERDKFAAQAQAANDKRRETVANFKCSVDSLQRQVSRHEDAVEPAKAALVTVPEEPRMMDQRSPPPVMDVGLSTAHISNPARRTRSYPVMNSDAAVGLRGARLWRPTRPENAAL
ncbi:hypothetical protein C8R44DRAFT_49900 [Mycena epipterygia]|nr:hypothetical protein C8R44DRAFT_49900 [Mycena epipterygia]